MKLLVSDYDGTYNSDIGFPSIATTNKCIEEFRRDGNLFAIATARNYNSLKREIDRYNIPYDYLICSNGCSIFDKDDKIIYSDPISIESCQKALSILYKYDIIFKRYLLDVYGNETTNLDEVCEIYVFINPFKYRKIAKLKNELSFLSIFKFLHIMTLTEKSDKSFAIERVWREQCDVLPRENIYAIGNASNDKMMIESYNGYRMFLSSPGLISTGTESVTSVSKLVKKISGGNNGSNRNNS